MFHYITTDHLVNAATKAITEELFREFGKALQSFCNEERGRIVIFRTLRYTRIRLHVLRKYLPDDDVLIRNTQNRFLDITIGCINTELDYAEVPFIFDSLKQKQRYANKAKKYKEERPLTFLL